MNADFRDRAPCRLIMFEILLLERYNVCERHYSLINLDSVGDASAGTLSDDVVRRPASFAPLEFDIAVNKLQPLRSRNLKSLVFSAKCATGNVDVIAHERSLTDSVSPRFRTY